MTEEYLEQKEILKHAIKKKLNYRKIECNSDDPRAEHDYDGIPQTFKVEYDGLEMSGFNNSRYENMELLSRFKNYMERGGDDRNPYHYVPICWKGSINIYRIGFGYQTDGSIELEGEYAGADTYEIIMRTILLQNPHLLASMKAKDEIIEKEINDDLSILKKENPDYETSKIITKFKRDYSLVQELKKKHKKCQICEFTFKKKNGENYNETHHIIPLSKNGKDEKINTLVLCANCHRQLHYADVNISKIFQNKISINGIQKEIKND